MVLKKDYNFNLMIVTVCTALICDGLSDKTVHTWTILVRDYRGSPYLANSWVVVGIDPGMSRIDASGTVRGDRSGRFMYYIVSVWRFRLAVPSPVSVATSA
jgi:hypothetical protein